MLVLQVPSKTLFEMVAEGGVWMMPFLLLSIWWLVLLLRAVRAPASLGKGLVFLLFPVGFALIALVKVVLFHLEEFHLMAQTGRSGETSQLIAGGLIFARSTLIVLGMGGVSFFVAAGFIWKGVAAEKQWRRRGKGNEGG